MNEEEREKERRELNALHQPRAKGPVRAKERNRAHSERFTTAAEAMEALRAKMDATPRTNFDDDNPHCRHCGDTGWQEIDATGRGTVRYCPAGCLPRRPKASQAVPAGKRTPRTFE